MADGAADGGRGALSGGRGGGARTGRGQAPEHAVAALADDLTINLCGSYTDEKGFDLRRI